MRKVLVLFVEPMHYIMDLIHEVYEKTPYEYQYVFCCARATGRDTLQLPEGSVVCCGTKEERKTQIKRVFKRFRPDFAVINGYVRIEQREAIFTCMKKCIPFAIESDTPLHIPKDRIKAIAKKIYLYTIFRSPFCHGFPGGTLQKENLVYYGIPEKRCFIMPMCVSTERMRKEAERLPDKEILKEQHGLCGKDIFLFVGRLVKVKNIPVLLQAFKDYLKENPNAALVLVGNGQEMAALVHHVSREDIRNVYFEGYIGFPKLAEYYKMADVFVLPSCHEPWGLVVNEAQIFELPVIVSSKVGCREDLIIEGETGFVFENNNAAMLKTAMEKALALKAPTVRMSERWNHVLYHRKFVDAVEQICK